METTDQKTIVKRIAKMWNIAKINYGDAPNGIFEAIEGDRMLSYRYALESTGLTLNEIIALGDADNLDEAIDQLFSKNTQKTKIMENNEKACTHVEYIFYQKFRVKHEGVWFDVITIECADAACKIAQNELKNKAIDKLI